MLSESKNDVASGIMRAALVFTVMCISGYTQNSSDPQRGRIEGVVQDERGQPIAEARVTATPLGRPIFGVAPWTTADAQGRFVLAGLLPGRVSLTASKEEDFYPNTQIGAGFWTTEQASRIIDLPTGSDVSGILIKMFPAARLKVTAINSSNGANIDNATLHIEREASPDKYISGHFPQNECLVPAEAIRLRIDAAGFESTWYSQGNTPDHSSVLSLAPRQIQTVVISLRPLRN